MQSSTNNSFIPKRSSKRPRITKPVRKIFLVTIIAYSLLFAALIAAGATVLYKNYTETLLQKEVEQLDHAINTFSVQDFKRVQEFDKTLSLAKERIDNTISLVVLLDEIDRVTAQPIQINKLELEREGDSNLSLVINFTTETLDATLFQRKVLSANSAIFSDVTISDVDIQNTSGDSQSAEKDTPQLVTFVAKFTVPITTVLYDPANARRTDVGVPLVNQPITTTNNSVETENVPVFESGVKEDETATATQVNQTQSTETNEINL
jgi:hypothetical protein